VSGAGPNPCFSLLVALTVSLARGTAAALWWRTYQHRETRSRNERSASAALKERAVAEADLRANDRDRNGVNDFWTADVQGLYTFGLIRSALRAGRRDPAERYGPNPPVQGLSVRAGNGRVGDSAHRLPAGNRREIREDSQRLQVRIRRVRCGSGADRQVCLHRERKQYDFQARSALSRLRELAYG
jgi:hypothetical protein